MLRWFGLNRKFEGNKWKQDIKYSGYKFHLNNIASRIGFEQMKHVEKIIKLHQRNGQFYDKFINNKKIKLIKKEKNLKSSYWLYSILVMERKIRNIWQNKIQCDEVSFRNDKYTVFKNLEKNSMALIILTHMINIPVGWWLSIKDVKMIKNIINQY